MYAIRKNQIIEIEQMLNQSQNGSWWCILKGQRKRKLISKYKMFETKEDAQEALPNISKTIKENIKNYRKNNSKVIFEQELQEVDEVMDKIFQEFGVEVAFLSKPVLVEDAWNLYYRIQKNKELRNQKIIK